MIRVSQEKVCAPQDEIRATLSFRWRDENVDAVMVDFQRTSFGGQRTETVSCFEGGSGNTSSKKARPFR